MIDHVLLIFFESGQTIKKNVKFTMKMTENSSKNNFLFVPKCKQMGFTRTNDKCGTQTGDRWLHI